VLTQEQKRTPYQVGRGNRVENLLRRLLGKRFVRLPR